MMQNLAVKYAIKTSNAQKIDKSDVVDHEMQQEFQNQQNQLVSVIQESHKKNDERTYNNRRQNIHFIQNNQKLMG